MFLPKISTSAPFKTALLLRPTHLPHLLLHEVWTAFIGDPTDRLDATTSKARSAAFFALAPLCSRQVQPVTGAAKAISEILDPKGLEAFPGLHQRAQHASCDFWHLLWGQGAAAWEACMLVENVSKGARQLHQDTANR
jgi:hypothetical protein